MADSSGYGYDLSELSPDLAAEARRIKRRDALAELMVQQSLQPTQGQMVGRFYAPPSALQGAAKMLQAYTGAQRLDKNDQAYENIGIKQRQAVTDELTRIQGIRAGAPERPAALDPQEVQQSADQGTPLRETMPAVAGDPRKAVQEAMLSRFKSIRDFGNREQTDIRARELAAEAQKERRFIAGESDKRSRDLAAISDARARELSATSDARMRELATMRDETTRAGQQPKPFTLGEGQQRFDADGNPIAAGGPKTFASSAVNKVTRVPLGDRTVVMVGTTPAFTFDHGESPDASRRADQAAENLAARMSETQIKDAGDRLVVMNKQGKPIGDIEKGLSPADTERARVQLVIEDGRNTRWAEVSGNAAQQAETAAAGQDVTMRGQDLTAGTAAAGQGVTTRGQDITSATTRRGQDITAETSDKNRAAQLENQIRRLESTASIAELTHEHRAAIADAVNTLRRELGILQSETARRGQDLTARTALGAQGTQARGQDIRAKTAADALAAKPPPVLQQKITEIMAANPDMTREEASNIATRVVSLRTNPVTGDSGIANIAKGAIKPLDQPAPTLPPMAPPTAPTLHSLAGAGEATGPGPAAERLYGRVAGWVGLEGGQKAIAAATTLNTSTQQLIRSLAVNQRFPVAEMTRLREEIDIKPSLIDSGPALQTRMEAVAKVLKDRMASELQSADPKTGLHVKDRQSALANARHIQVYLNQLGVPEQGTSAPISLEDYLKSKGQ